MPLGFEKCNPVLKHGHIPVPEGQTTIAQRFNVGSWFYCDNSPEGTSDGRSQLGRPFGTQAPFAQRPNFEKLGYYQTSLWDDDEILVASDRNVRAPLY
jgi:hypothetical protein